MTRTIDQDSPPTNVGCTCQHPTDAVRWDEHRALLRCTSCGRKIEDGADLFIQRD
jgi:hypothetical protein